jgi:hypothetical protein
LNCLTNVHKTSYKELATTRHVRNFLIHRKEMLRRKRKSTDIHFWQTEGTVLIKCKLSECEALGRIRYSVLGPPGFELETIHQEPIKPLLHLIRKAKIFDGI